MKSTSERLKQIMKERKLRQVDILEKSKPFQKELNIKMSKSHLSQYVNGKSSPDQHKLYLLSKTLNVGEAWLMGYDVDSYRVPDEERQQDTTLSQVNKTTSNLQPPRQQKVLECAEKQLREQQEEEKAKQESEKKNNPSANNIIDLNKAKNNIFKEEENYENVETHGILAAGKGTLNFDKAYPIACTRVRSCEVPTNYDLAFSISGDSMEPYLKNGEIAYVLTNEPFINKKIYAVEVEQEAYIKKVYKHSEGYTLVSLNNDVDEEGNLLYPDIEVTEDDEFYIIGRVI